MTPTLARDLGGEKQKLLYTQSSETEKMSDGSIRAGDHKALPCDGLGVSSELSRSPITRQTVHNPHICSDSCLFMLLLLAELIIG